MAGGNFWLPFTAPSLASFSKWSHFAAAWLGSWTRTLPPARSAGGLVTSGKGLGVAAWGLLVQQVSSQLHCGMKP